MNRAKENRLMLAVGGFVLALVAVFFLFRPGSGATVGPFVAPTATPAISDQSKADAVALLSVAVQQRADDQIEPALESGNQALTKWPQYDAAQRFMLTVVPQATAAVQTAQARATMTADSEARRAHAGEIARQAYSTKAGLFLQRYADALGNLNTKSREARDQPALLVDSTWRYRTSAALATMQDASSSLAGLTPVPADMGTPIALFEQLATETAQLGQEYASGIRDGAASALPFASSRTERVLSLIKQANVEIRRPPPTTP